MAAATTDTQMKVARKWVGQIGSGGVADAVVTTVPLLSTTNLPTTTLITLVLGRVDSAGSKTPTAEETITGIVSGNNITNVTRGVEGTAQAHAAGVVVEQLITASQMNTAIDGFLVEHSQKGNHGDVCATSMIITGGTTASDLDACAITGQSLVITTGKITASDIDACAITAESLDLNASDDNITVAGADPWRTITLIPGALAPTTSSGCAAKVTVESGNGIDYDVLDFDSGSNEVAFINFQMPDSWDAGVVQFRYIWTNAGGGAAETVVFELNGRSFANDDPIDTAIGGTALEVEDTWIAQGDVHISPWSGDLTIQGTPAAGEFVHFKLRRDVSEDDLTGDARLMAVQVRYKMDQFSD